MCSVSGRVLLRTSWRPSRWHGRCMASESLHRGIASEPRLWLRPAIILVGSDLVGDRSKSIAILVQCFGFGRRSFEWVRIWSEIVRNRLCLFRLFLAAAGGRTRLACIRAARAGHIVQLTLPHTWQHSGSDDPGPIYQCPLSLSSSAGPTPSGRIY